MNEKKYMAFFLVLCLFLFKINPLFSQGPPPAASCPDPPCAPIPLDGGISILIAAGAAYGAKKVYGFSNNNKFS